MDRRESIRPVGFPMPYVNAVALIYIKRGRLHFRLWHSRTWRGGTTMSVDRGEPEVGWLAVNTTRLTPMKT
jgi:hypothetical protein